MRFGSVALIDANGAFLAHALEAGGEKFKKGTLLGPAEIARIGAAGIGQVIAARFEADDVGEDEAAGMLASLVAHHTLRLGPASTGRVNIYAQTDGLFIVDRALIDGFNAVDPAITIATLAEYAPVTRGQMVATVKIIPFAVSRAVIDAVVRLLSDASRVVLRVAPWAATRIGLISTTLPSLKAEIIDKTTRVLQSRLSPMGAALIGDVRVAHENTALAKEIQTMAAAAPDLIPDLIIVFGASAVVDAHDVIPEAIRLSGGKVTQVGMPVDPGNLLVLGCIGTIPVIGAPGCARSPKENGFDWILQRLIAGVVVGPKDFASMGVGGLLMEIETRPRPRDVSAPRPKVNVSSLLLAAGSSSRMGGAHKLRALFDGEPLLRRSLAVLEEALPEPPFVVLGFEAQKMASLIGDTSAKLIENSDYAEGISTSLRLGINNLPANCDGVVVHLADMPGVTAADIRKLVKIFVSNGGAGIVRATHNGKRGNPVILPRSVFSQVRKLTGDMGARAMIEAYGGEVIDVEIGSAASLDVDTPDAIKAAGGIIVA